jgi:hypothetical protein
MLCFIVLEDAAHDYEEEYEEGKEEDLLEVRLTVGDMAKQGRTTSLLHFRMLPLHLKGRKGKMST